MILIRAQMLTVVYDVLKDNELNDVTKFKLIEDFDMVLSLDLTKKEEVKIESALEEDIKKKIEERSEAKKLEILLRRMQLGMSYYLTV